MEENNKERGLYHRYDVKRRDGQDTGGEDYFVLRLDKRNPADLAALATYANVVEAEYPRLAADLRKRYGLAQSVIVGDIVHYYRADGGGGQKPCAAVITDINVDGSVADLHVMPTREIPFERVDVPFSVAHRPGTWTRIR